MENHRTVFSFIYSFPFLHGDWFHKEPPVISPGLIQGTQERIAHFGLNYSLVSHLPQNGSTGLTPLNSLLPVSLSTTASMVDCLAL